MRNYNRRRLGGRKTDHRCADCDLVVSEVFHCPQCLLWVCRLCARRHKNASQAD